MSSNWPRLQYKNWKDTLDTLHLWMQIVGKLKLKQNSFLNQWWEVGFYLTPRGITTGRIPYKEVAFEVLFDFIDHKLIISVSNGKTEILKLKSQTVKEFYTRFNKALLKHGIKIKVNTSPSEMPNVTIPFEKDTTHKYYDKKYIENWHQIQLKISFIFDKFRKNFRGKSSPVLFYWGSFDLNTTRFSGKKLQDKTDWPKGYHFMRYAENEENFSVGFWPGDERFPESAFYSYMYPAPKGCETINTGPEFSYFDIKLAESILPYEKVRRAKNPEEEILNFLKTTYAEYTKLAKWNTKDLTGLTPGSGD